MCSGCCSSGVGRGSNGLTGWSCGACVVVVVVVEVGGVVMVLRGVVVVHV